jgi:hypothetical protein
MHKLRLLEMRVIADEHPAAEEDLGGLAERWFSCDFSR